MQASVDGMYQYSVRKKPATLFIPGLAPEVIFTANTSLAVIKCWVYHLTGRKVNERLGAGIWPELFRCRLLEMLKTILSKITDSSNNDDAELSIKKL